MTKNEFISSLGARLSGLPKDEIRERLAFYGEMIDDRIEEGLAEEEAVADVGDVEDIAAQIIAETPLVKIVKDKIKPKRRPQAWEIVLIALGSPVWLSLAVAALAVVFAVLASVWAVVAAIWSVFAAVAASGAACVALGVCLIVLGKVYFGIAAIGVGLFCAGLSIFLFLGSVAATKGMARLSKLAIVGIKNCFVKREAR